MLAAVALAGWLGPLTVGNPAFAPEAIHAAVGALQEANGRQGEPTVEPRVASRGGLLAARLAITAQMVSCGTDYGVTMYAMGTGRFMETNPIWAWAEHRPVAMGLGKLGACAGVSAVLLKDHRRHPWRTVIIGSVLTAVNVWATARNTRTINR